MRCRRFLTEFSIISILLIGQANYPICAQTVKARFGETFTLKTDESAKIADGKLKVQLKTVGRTISENGETEYVELKVWIKKTERTITISERSDASKTVGGYVVKLINAESFGNTHCQLKISRKK